MENTLLNRRVDELTKQDITDLKREPRKKYRNIVNRICRLDDRAFANRGKHELGASEVIIDRIKKGDYSILQKINDTLITAKDIVLDLEDTLSMEDSRVVRVDRMTSLCFLTALNNMSNLDLIENVEVDLDAITYQASTIRNEEDPATKRKELNNAFEQIKRSNLNDLYKGVFKLVQDRNFEEIQRRTDLLEDYLKKIDVWEEVFSPKYRHLDSSNSDILNNKEIFAFEVELCVTVYCLQFMLIAINPSYDRVLRNRLEKKVSKMSW